MQKIIIEFESRDVSVFASRYCYRTFLPNILLMIAPL